MSDRGPCAPRTTQPGPYLYSARWSGWPLTDDSWRNQASCQGADPDIFMPESDEHGTNTATAVSYAKKVCRRCPVSAPCKVFALARRERYGVWGGLGRTQLRNIIAGWDAAARTDANDDNQEVAA